VLLAVGAYHLTPSQYHCDDLTWLETTKRGFLAGWTEPHPFNHFRPTFFSWFWWLRHATSATPAVLGMAGLALQVILLAMVYLLARTWLSVRGAAVATAIMAIHPVRQSHWFWASTQIDALCLVFTVAALYAATRAIRPESSRGWYVALAAFTGLAAFAKETAFALPLAVLLLPSVGSRRRRFIAFSISGAVVLGAIVWSAVVLGGGGRAGSLVTSQGLQGALRYPIQLFLPLDWFGLSNRYADLLGYRGTWRLSWLIGLGLGALLAVAMWRRREERWTHLSFLLMVWAGLAWLASKANRSIGLGALGFSVLLGGYTERWSRDRWVVVMLAALCLLWVPRWSTYLEQWQVADRHSAALGRSIAELREESGADEHFVVLGLPYRIGEMAEPVAVGELDGCASSAFMTYFANPEQVAPRAELEYPILRLRTLEPGILGSCNRPFRVSGRQLSDAAVVSRGCDPSGQLTEVGIDLESLATEARLESCSGAVPLLWTDRGLVRLQAHE
jgi:hypothetical protein